MALESFAEPHWVSVPVPTSETVVTPILGYRCWHPFGGVLSSVALHDIVWPKKNALRAVNGVHLRDEEVDRLLFVMDAGIHAYNSIENVIKNYGPTPLRYYVVGGVWLWGHIVTHEHGYRAEYAYPAFFLSNFDCIAVGFESAREQLQLARDYNIPIFEHIDDVPKDLYEREFIWGEWEKREKESDPSQWLYPSRKRWKPPLIGKYLKGSPLRPRWSQLKRLRRFLHRPREAFALVCFVPIACNFWFYLFAGMIGMSLLNAVVFIGMMPYLSTDIVPVRWGRNLVFLFMGTVYILALLSRL